MRILLDTNVLITYANHFSPLQEQVVTSFDQLDNIGFRLFVVPQVIYEFWVVATRPVTSNGLGMSPKEASEELNQMRKLFVLLKDERGVFNE